MNTHDERALVTTCPDGVVIETPFPGEWNPESIFALDRHADQHRKTVRAHLHAMRLMERAA
jgi:hypothetical protein